MSRAIPIIIVLTPNTLSSIGLRDILVKLLPFASVRIYYSVEELRQVDSADIFHIFVWSQILIENIALFEPLKSKTIVLANGTANSIALGEYHQIDTQQGEEEICNSLKSLHTRAHGSNVEAKDPSEKIPAGDLLSPREIEVAKLLVEGLINKEIAARLNIGLTTVITHRKNIFDKLNIRSLAGLTIYAIMKRYIEI